MSGKKLQLVLVKRQSEKIRKSQLNVLCENTHAQLLIKKISLMCKLIAQKSYIWCLKALKWHHDEVPFLIWQKLQNLWSPKVLQKAKMIFFTHSCHCHFTEVFDGHAWRGNAEWRREQWSRLSLFIMQKTMISYLTCAKQIFHNEENNRSIRNWQQVRQSNVHTEGRGKTECCYTAELKAGSKILFGVNIRHEK